MKPFLTANVEGQVVVYISYENEEWVVHIGDERHKAVIEVRTKYEPVIRRS